MTGKSGLAVRFGPFTLDDRARTLRRGAAAVHLPPKAFDLLTLLVQRYPAAVARAEIHQHLWPGTFVSEGNLAVLVAEIRQALGDSVRKPRFIRTVQRFGYAFAGVLGESAAGAALRREPAAGWIVWGVRRAALAVGENVLGRDPSVDINIDAVGVSRRHAMIVVADDQITLSIWRARTAPLPAVRVSPVRCGSWATPRSTLVPWPCGSALRPVPRQHRQRRHGTASDDC